MDGSWASQIPGNPSLPIDAEDGSQGWRLEATWTGLPHNAMATPARQSRDPAKGARSGFMQMHISRPSYYRLEHHCGLPVSPHEEPHG